mgnify:CR=1 FL=1
MSKYDLSFQPPLMNAAGTLGFAPGRRAALDWTQFGAFITNPISLEPRAPAQERNCLTFPGGFLLRTGFPNPGLRQVLRRYALRWARSPLSVIVHLLVQRSEDLPWQVRLLEAAEGVTGVELGLPPDVDPETAQSWVSAAAGELPLIVRVPMERALALAPVVMDAGAAAVSLGAPRGALSAPNGKFQEGRLYGPAVFPLALHTARRLSQMKLPVIGAGGVYHPAQVEAMLAAGAIAVQLDAVLWRGGLPSPENPLR